MTSQILANVYLNEFDRYIRHTIKPLAYLRYGDDFVVFCPNQVHTQDVKQQASDWLIQNLSLKTHSTNNIIAPANSGLKFLGHRIYADSITIDKNNSRKVAQLSSTDA